MSPPIRILIAGAGRMGSAIAAMIERDDGFSLAGIWSRGADLEALVSTADVVVDFSMPEATATVAGVVTRLRKPLVCGVTGLDEAQTAVIARAAASVPVVCDSNMSQGISVLDEVLRKVASALGENFSTRIQETHHAGKQDAPSGTALKLGKTVASERGVDASDIDYISERRGDVPGDHAVIFTSDTEVLTLSHSARSRDVFADGALRAAAWAVRQPPGLYSMRDVLFGDPASTKKPV